MLSKKPPMSACSLVLSTKVTSYTAHPPSTETIGSPKPASAHGFKCQRASARGFLGQHENLAHKKTTQRSPRCKGLHRFLVAWKIRLLSPIKKKGSRITFSQKSFKKNQIKYDQICSQEVGKSKNPHLIDLAVYST